MMQRISVSNRFLRDATRGYGDFIAIPQDFHTRPLDNKPDCSACYISEPGGPWRCRQVRVNKGMLESMWGNVVMFAKHKGLTKEKLTIKIPLTILRRSVPSEGTLALTIGTGSIYLSGLGVYC